MNEHPIFTVTPLTAPTLEPCGGIAHGFFSREGGVSTGLYGSLNCGPGSGDAAVLVVENRARCAKALALKPGHLLTLYQIHSASCVKIDSPWTIADRPQADAMVTTKPGIGLGILTADCGPVLFADPDARVIGAAHAGWGGALKGVLEATLDAMEALGASRTKTIAALGPMISQQAYQVGAEFYDRFTGTDPAWEQFFTPSALDQHWQFDLPGFIGHRLHAAGIGALYDAGLCTYNNGQRFFSYRRTSHKGERDYGRQISVIALTGTS